MCAPEREPAAFSRLLTVVYLLVLFRAFALLRAVLPRAFWLARLEHRWIDLWMR
jgi:hypothetical protein